MIQLRLSGNFLLLPVRVTPKGGRDCILTFQEGDTALKLKVSAPPEDGKANTAVIKLLSDALGIPKSRFRIHQGETSRHKQVSITLSEPDDVEILTGRLSGLLQAQSCLSIRE